jgi:hypothetical protein
LIELGIFFFVQSKSYPVHLIIFHCNFLSKLIFIHKNEIMFFCKKTLFFVVSRLVRISFAEGKFGVLGVLPLTSIVWY